MDSETREKARILDHAYPTSEDSISFHNYAHVADKDEDGASLVSAVYGSVRRMVFKAVNDIEGN